MDEILKYALTLDLQGLFEKWLAAIKDPGQFLNKGFAPTEQQVIDAFKFYLAVISVSLIIFGLISLFVERGPLGIKAKMVANGLLGIISLLVTAAAAYFPFWLLGGKATFSGTLLAYIYASVPYGPLIAIGQWIFVAGMPAHLRPYALNAATSYEAGKIAASHPDADKMTLYTGTLIGLALFLWAFYLAAWALGLVHDVGGWRLAIALILWLVISMPVGAIFNRMAALMYGTPQAAQAAAEES
jgi:hypothetical protein